MALVAALSGCPAPEGAGDAKRPPPRAPRRRQEKNALYAFGASLGRYASGMKLSESDVQSIQEGLRDALLGKTLDVDPRSLGPRLQKLSPSAAPPPRPRRRRPPSASSPRPPR